MKTPKILLISLALITLTICISCTKKKDYEKGPIESEWLLPILKGDISPAYLTTLIGKEFSIDVTADDLGAPSSSTSKSTYSVTDPYDMDLPDIIDSILLDTCHITLTMRNEMPATIESGAKVSIRNAGETTDLLTKTLNKDIAEGDTLVYHIDLSNKDIGNELEVYVNDVTLSPYSNMQPTDAVYFNLKFEKVSFRAVVVETGNAYDVKDTTDFDGSDIKIEDDDLQNIEDKVKATITFMANNELPVNLSLQAYFLDDQNQVIDSLFSPTATVEAATYSGGQFSKEKESKFETTISKDRIDKIQDAKKLSYKIHMDTYGNPGSSLHINADQKASIKVTGDINLTLSPSLFTN